jgi:4-hydroxy-tetrahydrodipicolinate synthase
VKSPSGPGRFGAVITAMVTPFDENGGLDVDGAVTLARWLTSHGSDGLVVAGTTGEGPVLSDAELGQLWQAVTEAVTVPVLAGTGSNDTRHTIECTKLAQAAGVAGALVVTPYYSRPSQTGLSAHFRAVAACTKLPVVLYDIPVRAGRRIARDTMVGLAREVPNIVGVKDATADPAGSARLMAEAPEGFELYSGDDALTLALLALGAVGAVSVASHWAGEEIAEMVAAWFKGDADGARAWNARLLESYDFESSETYPNPLPAKAACRVLGLASGQCRLPLGAAPTDLDDRARTVISNLGRDMHAVAGARAGGSIA